MLKELLSYGFFPKELPPPFETISFGEFVIKNIGYLKGNKPSATKTLLHNLSRAGGLCRKLSIPNPISFYFLCNEIDNNWNDILQKLNVSKISLTSPVFEIWKNRAIKTKHSFYEREIFITELRSISRYILKTDISRFYSSVYTHIIPWAIYGKEFAKCNKWENDLYGNKLDKFSRNIQDQQTNGIPIGPDTSLIISELILSDIDHKISEKFPRKNSSYVKKTIRFMDDYEFGFTTKSEAEECLSIVQEVLQEFHLEINNEKTKIIELPYPVTKDWTSFLRTFNFELPHNDTDTNFYYNNNQKNELIKFIDYVFNYIKSNKDENIIKYAIATLRGITITEKNWNLLENLLLQCALVDSSCIKFVLEQLLDYQNKKYVLEKDKIQECFNEIIIKNSKLNNGNEVAWAIWGMIELGLKIDKESMKQIEKMEDNIVRLVYLDAFKRNLLASTPSFNEYIESFNNSDFNSENWLFYYEVFNYPEISNSRTADGTVKKLRDNGVKFYNLNNRFERKKYTYSSGGGYPL